LRRSGVLDSNLDPWWPPADSGIVVDVARVTTRAAGRFTALPPSQAESFLLPCLGTIAPMNAPGVDCAWGGSCVGEFGRFDASCGADGQCACTGGALGSGSFTSSCALGMQSVMAAAAAACEASPVRPNIIPSSSWWEVVPGAQVGCSNVLDDVGGFVWFGPEDPETGLPSYVVNDEIWCEPAQPVGVGTLNVVAAEHGVATEVLLPDCLTVRRSEDSECATPIGCTAGVATKLAPILIEHWSIPDNEGTSVHFVDNSTASPVFWSADCQTPAGSVTSCRCFAVGDPDWVEWTGDMSAAEALLLRFWDGTATEADASALLTGCGWSSSMEIDLRTNLNAAGSNPQSQWRVPVCLAP